MLLPQPPTCAPFVAPERLFFFFDLFLVFVSLSGPAVRAHVVLVVKTSSLSTSFVLFFLGDFSPDSPLEGAEHPCHPSFAFHTPCDAFFPACG